MDTQQTASLSSSDSLTEPVVVDRSPELKRGTSYDPRYAATGFMRACEMFPEDITEGKKGDGAACAFARVIKRSFPEATNIHLEGEHPGWDLPRGGHAELAMPPEMIDWIGRFDRGEEVEPMTLFFVQ